MKKRQTLTGMDALDELQVMLAMEGDQRAFTLLYRRWHPRLLRHAQRLTRHPDDARDVMQEAAMAIAGNIHRLQSPAKFGPWAYTIVRNHVANHITRQERDRKLNQEIRTEINIRQSETCNTSKIDQLRELIRTLPVTDQEVLFAYYVDGMSVKELSSCFCLAQGTVKSRLHTARAHLKSAYESMKGNHDE